ncbi:MAG: hypothetical protein RIT27_1974 [Pseudomonadota bacterium]|jgi:hypothetical protein
MINVTQFDISILPENAQIELYDFYLFLKQRYTKVETNDKTSKIDAIFPRKLSNITPFTRDEIYEQ